MRGVGGARWASRWWSVLGTTLALAAAAPPAAGRAAAQTPRVVDIPAADGVTLKGTLFAAPRPGPAVLLLHQCDDRRTVWDPLGLALARAGVTALAVDYRGYGESGGTPHDQLTPQQEHAVTAEQWPGDLDAAFAFLLRQPGVRPDRVGVGGASCGVNQAIGLARRHPDVRALALLAGGTDRVGRLFLQAAGAPPVFTAAAADDPYLDFVAVMRWLHGVSQDPRSRFAQYPSGGHAAVVFRTHPGLADTIATWFGAVLADPPRRVPATNGVPMRADALRALAELDRPGGARAAGARLARRHARDPGAQLFPEYGANQLGYEHAAMGDLPGALDIMRLEVAAYPASPNAMDSLGDVYLARGDTAAALTAARRTLELLDRDTVDSEQRKRDLRGAAEQKLKTLH